MLACGPRLPRNEPLAPESHVGLIVSEQLPVAPGRLRQWVQLAARQQLAQFAACAYEVAGLEIGFERVEKRREFLSAMAYWVQDGIYLGVVCIARGAQVLLPRGRVLHALNPRYLGVPARKEPQARILHPPYQGDLESRVPNGRGLDVAKPAHHDFQSARYGCQPVQETALRDARVQSQDRVVQPVEIGLRGLRGLRQRVAAVEVLVAIRQLGQQIVRHDLALRDQAQEFVDLVARGLRRLLDGAHKPISQLLAQFLGRYGSLRHYLRQRGEHAGRVGRRQAHDCDGLRHPNEHLTRGFTL